ncbi:MAG: hypothetical protein WC052_05665 [Patescibacteria group bacterium]
MITVTYIVEAPTFGCNLALNDSQAMQIFNQLKEGVDAHITIANEFAYDVLRTLIAEDKISFEHVELILHDKAKVTRHRFNTFGNLLSEDGTGPFYFETPSDIFMRRRWLALAAKQRTRRLERDKQLQADREARLGLTIPEPILQAVLAEDADCRKRLGLTECVEQLMTPGADVDTALAHASTVLGLPTTESKL